VEGDLTEPPWGECQTAERTWKGPTPKKKRDPHETKDAEAKKRPQTETPQMQAHEDTPKEVEELGDDDYHRRRL
jgi:hypothetical protein